MMTSLPVGQAPAGPALDAVVAEDSRYPEG
jgi:hypothetical protein